MLVAHYRKDLKALERVQRRFARMTPGFGGMSFRDVGQTLIVFSGLPEGVERPDGGT